MATKKKAKKKKKVAKSAVSNLEKMIAVMANQMAELEGKVILLESRIERLEAAVMGSSETEPAMGEPAAQAGAESQQRPGPAMEINSMPEQIGRPFIVQSKGKQVVRTIYKQPPSKRA